MSSLTQVAITARKSIKYTILFIIFLTVGRILLGVFISVYLTIFPPAPPPPTVKFGKLAKIHFPVVAPKAKLNFSLETATGGLPTNIPSQEKVYFMPKLNSNLLALDKAKQKAGQLGFLSQNPEMMSDVLYKFPFANFPTHLAMNIVTGNFSISYDLSTDRSAIANKPPPAEVAATDFRNYLSAADSLPKDLTGPMVPEYFKLEGGSLTKVLALSEADVTKVNLFRKEYNKLPSLTAYPNRANVWGILGGAPQRGQKVLGAEYHYFPVDESQFSTYPLITPEAAFKALQDGNSYIASIGKYKEGDSLKIRNIYLAYYDPSTQSDFYQPIYVFDSSDNDPQDSFVGYVTAVDPSYIAEN